MHKAKPFSISKEEVYKAYKQVKAKRGAAGVDRQSIGDFDKRWKDNLYKLWNRMSSGSYFPPPVKRVEIPKANGETRPLGIPTVADRIAQMVVKNRLEPELDKHFDPDSYGYRPGKSALEAVGVARKRCWQYDRVKYQSTDYLRGERGLREISANTHIVLREKRLPNLRLVSVSRPIRRQPH